MHRTLVNVNPAYGCRSMEEVFEQLFGQPTSTGTPVGALPLDVFEQEGKLIVRAAVPGIEPNDLDIQIEKNVLSIRGETKHESESKEAKVYRREVSYGSFARSIRLPEGLDLNAIEADFKYGMVTITLPRIPEEKPLAIKVNVRTTDTSQPESN